MDIFDAADLLAIEQDAQSSSSSSCSDSDSAVNGSQKDNPFHDNNIFMEQPSNPHESEGDDGNATKPSAHNLLSGRVEDSDDDDDSSSDDGFLAMLALDKKSTQDNNMQQKSENKLLQEEGHQTINDEDNETRNSLDESANVAIQLGDSVVRWISCHQASKDKQKKKQSNVDERPMCKYDGVISIQSRENVGLNNDMPSSARRLSIRNKRKRQSAGCEVAEATIEQFDASSGDTQNSGKRLCGQATLAPDAGRANLGTMVDCLARYDPDKGAYVLEIVDLDVSGLTTTTPEDDNGNGKSEEDDDEIAALTGQPRSTIADPRSRAKQAEMQLRKLKQGRGTRSERKRSKLEPDTDSKK